MDINIDLNLKFFSRVEKVLEIEILTGVVRCVVHFQKGLYSLGTIKAFYFRHINI